MTDPLLQAWADANPGSTIHDLSSDMTIRTDDIDDLLPSEYQEPWPPLSDEEIEERERQAEFQNFLDSIPDSAERNRNLK